MFEFLLDMRVPYEDRAVAPRFEQGDLMVSTVRVSDGTAPYETAIQHPDYNEGEWIVVEAYDTAQVAERGHARWIKAMTTEPLPEELIDCANAGIAQFGSALGADLTYRRKK